MDTDHIPVPTQHSPNRDMHCHPEAFDGVAVTEVENADAWVWSDTTVEVRQ